MPFIELDFLLALIKNDDLLKEKAVAAYEKYKSSLWTTGFTIAELLLLSEEYGLDPEKLVIHTYRLVRVSWPNEQIALLAAHYMKEEGLTTFDALNAAFATDS